MNAPSVAQLGKDHYLLGDMPKISISSRFEMKHFSDPKEFLEPRESGGPTYLEAANAGRYLEIAQHAVQLTIKKFKAVLNRMEVIKVSFVVNRGHVIPELTIETVVVFPGWERKIHATGKRMLVLTSASSMNNADRDAAAEAVENLAANLDANIKIARQDREVTDADITAFTTVFK